MSFIVMGMEMPNNCEECEIYFCDKWIGHNENTRPKDCPLRPLPEKYGPLIDRTELEKAVLKWLPPDPCGREEKEYPFETDICVSIMMEIEEQEIVVEAEGE